MPAVHGIRIVTVTVVAALTLVACSGGDDVASDLPRPTREFCAAAARDDQAVSQQKLTLAQHEKLTHAIAREAPEDARADARIVWKSFVKLRAGDTSVVDNPEVKNAIDHVNRRASQDCGWFRRQGL